MLVLGIQLLVDLLKGEEADLRRLLAVALHPGGGVLVAGQPLTVLILGPVEKPGENFPEAIGGLRGKSFSLDLAGNERGDVGGGDLLETVGLDVVGSVPVGTFPLRAYLGRS